MIERRQMDERMNFDTKDRSTSENGNPADADTEFAWDRMCDGIIHVIQKGDTLYRLSGQYHVSVFDIMYKNPYANVYNLQVGDEICIPVSRMKRR
ncbi:MAG: LysM domain-containing protein [Lachnospiraceae bacterium]|nr:LysM domain-containing protein [Lachnospiraceae bacterium]